MQIASISTCFPHEDEPGKENKQRGQPEGGFWSGSINGSKASTVDNSRWWWSGQGGSGRLVSLVSRYLNRSVFDWLHSHRFLYSSVKPAAFSFFLEGHLPPPVSLLLQTHSSFSRWHLLPTHLHCVPIIYTDSKASTQMTHTHKCAWTHPW